MAKIIEIVTQLTSKDSGRRFRLRSAKEMAELQLDLWTGDEEGMQNEEYCTVGVIEEGEIISCTDARNDTIVVFVDEKYREEGDPDGLREVSLMFLEPVGHDEHDRFPAIEKVVHESLDTAVANGYSLMDSHWTERSIAEDLADYDARFEGYSRLEELVEYVKSWRESKRDALTKRVYALLDRRLARDHEHGEAEPNALKTAEPSALVWNLGEEEPEKSEVEAILKELDSWHATKLEAGTPEDLISFVESWRRRQLE